MNRKNSDQSMTVEEIREKLRNLADKDKAKILQGFFKTGPGEYGEGDQFLGVTVPVLRKLAKECKDTSLADTVQLLRSLIHEERLLSLFLLINCFANGGEPIRQKIYSLYLRNSEYINNWDLVDLSAPNIVGNYLADKPREELYGLANSQNLWKRRIAILATFHFIKHHDFSDALGISERLIKDEHDLIHKAVGWMLREVGKRDLSVEEKFLRKHYKTMPRTMLRYAIERFPEAKRLGYLNGKRQ